ncbi:diacylglycerol kinase family protein [Aquabacterium sp. A7-Y]|uniref:diacylglycerol/lipid kinase family protein n=1 Tax=Aquabacterium sp. A7-Y TaxID=1349605 RepID=UPI00223D3997|nr:diacylglycerol kinase family protein [Aquabacterium sp. A7-Y]MCW7539413.1 diacylglycerol kinase family protein [Aquabacterium sp. A7-Y]
MAGQAEFLAAWPEAPMPGHAGAPSSTTGSAPFSRPATDGPLYIVLNLRSGEHGGSPARHAIEGVLSEAGRRFELLPVHKGSQVAAVAARAVARAREQGGVVVAAGGDGTINCVAQAVLDAGLAFGVLPQGTFNYFGRAHSIPLDAAAATRALLSARLEPTQVGLVNDRLFLVNASLGLYPKLLEDREAYKRQYGRRRWVALWSGLVTLLRHHRRMLLRIEYEGLPRLVESSTLFIGNNSLQLEQVGIAEAESLEQGRLVGLSVKPVSRWAMLGLVLRGAVGRLGEAENVLSFDFRRLEVQPVVAPGRKVRVKVATDGETAWMHAPLTFRVAPRPLWLLKPLPPEVPPSA